ncbi:MAG: outer membrane protein transport protein [bacterium]
MTRKIFLAVLFFTAAISNSIFAGGIEVREIGAKANAMGGAFRALADDGTAVFWNPAGLTQIKNQNFSFDAPVIQTRAKISQNFYGPGVIGGYETGEVNQKKTWALVPVLAYACDLQKEKLKFGLAVYTQHGLGMEYDFFSSPDYPAYPEIDWKGKAAFTSVHPAIAGQVNDRVSIGIGVFATRGDLEERGVLVAPGAAVNPALAGLNIPIDKHLKGDGWGYGGNAGVLCKVNKEFNCGLTYRSSTRVEVSGDSDVSAYGPASLGLGLLKSETAPSSVEITLPANVGFGLVYKPQEKLTLSTDIDWTEWSSFSSFEVTNTVDTTNALITSKSNLVFEWKNIVRYSFGLKYNLEKNWNIYGGYYIDPSPIPDRTLTPLIPDSGNKQSFRAAFGYESEKYELILGYEYLTTKSRTVNGSPVDADGDTVPDNLPGNYTLKVTTVRLGGSILF